MSVVSFRLVGDKLATCLRSSDVIASLCAAAALQLSQPSFLDYTHAEVLLMGEGNDLVILSGLLIT